MKYFNMFSLSKKRVGALFTLPQMQCSVQADKGQVAEEKLIKAVEAARSAFFRVWNAPETVTPNAGDGSAK